MEPFTEEEKKHLIEKLGTVPREYRWLYIDMVISKLENATRRKELRECLVKIFTWIDLGTTIHLQ